MNPALIILIVIAAILLWFLLSFAFTPLGKLIYRIGKDAVDEMNKEENKEKGENKQWKKELLEQYF